MGDKKQLITELLKNINGGEDVASSYLGLTRTAFHDRRYENKGVRFFSGDELLALQHLSGTALVAEFYAEQAGCMVVSKVKAEEMGNFDLYMAILGVMESAGGLAKVIKDSIDNDGRIDDMEEKAIRAGAKELIKKITNTTENSIALHK